MSGIHHSKIRRTWPVTVDTVLLHLCGQVRQHLGLGLNTVGDWTSLFVRSACAAIVWHCELAARTRRVVQLEAATWRGSSRLTIKCRRLSCLAFCWVSTTTFHSHLATEREPTQSLHLSKWLISFMSLLNRPLVLLEVHFQVWDLWS